MIKNEFFQKFKNLNVLIVGDVMLDRYWWGSVSRISPEAPVPVVNLSDTTLAAGGAANVAANIAGLGATPYLVGVIGEDSEAVSINSVLSSKNISTQHLIKMPERKTTVKTRIIAHSQQVVRVDQETKSILSEQEEKIVWDKVLSLLNDIQIIIVSDYGKGVLTENLLARLITTARSKNLLVIVDPKGKNYQKYYGATILTPNRFEVAEALQLEDFEQSTIENAGIEMISEFDLTAMLITQGEAGMTLFEKACSPHHLTVTARKVYDVTGAGDTVIACLTAAIGVGESLLEAAKFANIAAGLVVEQVGTTNITLEMIENAK